MKAEVTNITPELAKELLKNNKANRSILTKRVNQYANDIINGNWQLNGEAICIDENGDLLNGQHRLSAVIKANRHVQMLVVTGVSPDTTIYDLHRNRTYNDIFKMSGRDEDIFSMTFSACARLDRRLMTGESYISQPDTEAFILEHEETLRTLAGFGLTTKCGNNLSTRYTPLVLACMYALEAGVKPESVRRFVQVYKTGYYDKNGETAAIAIRNDVITKRITPYGGGKERELAVGSFEKALYDFAHNTPRTKTYSKFTGSIYRPEKRSAK